MINLTIANLFTYSTEIEREEFERIIRKAVKRDDPKRKVQEIVYNDGGISIGLDDGSKINVDIDWQEIIIKE